MVSPELLSFQEHPLAPLGLFFLVWELDEKKLEMCFQKQAAVNVCLCDVTDETCHRGFSRPAEMPSQTVLLANCVYFLIKKGVEKPGRGGMFLKERRRYLR